MAFLSAGFAVTVLERVTLPEMVVVAGVEPPPVSPPPPPPPHATSSKAAIIEKRTDKKLLFAFRHPSMITPFKLTRHQPQLKQNKYLT
jgi:hypothetical protein